MTYAPATRPYYDADSHIMELPDFLLRYADPDLRDELPEVDYTASIVTDDEVAEIVAQGNRHSDGHRAAQIALGDDLIAKSKEIQALGAFDKADRAVALDMLGFKKQLVFATHSVVTAFHPSSSVPSRIRYGGARAHNRHMADFCADDDRLIGVGVCALDDPEAALVELDAALDLGLQAIWVPHRAPIGHSPGHVDLEPFWARLADAGVPFVIHVGGSPLHQAKAWSNNGRGATKDFFGGGENVRTKDALLLHHPPEAFVSMLVADGVFERHPNLRGAAVELGAGWVPEMLRRLDMITGIYSRVDSSVKFDRRPSEQITAQMAFTPLPSEDVARLVQDSNDELYLFSSDYPHIEGGRDPIGKFERAVASLDENAQTRFFSENFLRLWPAARV
ncbi:MAG: amidohydrolase family protein [Actinomycetota bacterium]